MISMMAAILSVAPAVRFVTRVPAPAVRFATRVPAPRLRPVRACADDGFSDGIADGFAAERTRVRERFCDTRPDRAERVFRTVRGHENNWVRRSP